MKKALIIICVVFTIIMITLFMNLKTIQKKNLEIKQFNTAYEFYNQENLCGVDITTVINKAIDNNEKYEIKKDSTGEYISDNEYSIKIYIKMIINNKTYPMEKIVEVGLENFTELFGPVKFKCTNVKYHKANGRIAEMIFETVEY